MVIMITIMTITKIRLKNNLDIQAKRRSGSFAAGGRDGDLVEEAEGEETVLKDNIMTDIKEGFIQRRLPDGGFKVKMFLV